MSTREFPGNLPGVRVRKWHLFIGHIHSKTRENKCHFSEKPLGTPLEAIEFPFFCAKGVPQEHSKKWHPESDTWTRWIPADFKLPRLLRTCWEIGGDRPRNRTAYPQRSRGWSRDSSIQPVENDTLKVTLGLARVLKAILGGMCLAFPGVCFLFLPPK